MISLLSIINNDVLLMIYRYTQKAMAQRIIEQYESNYVFRENCTVCSGCMYEKVLRSDGYYDKFYYNSRTIYHNRFVQRMIHNRYKHFKLDPATGHVTCGCEIVTLPNNY